MAHLTLATDGGPTRLVRLLTVAEDNAPAVDGRRARHAHRRPELLAAATDYVFENGLAGLTIRPLATELGITHRGLLHHFGSKEELIGEILHELRERDRRQIAEFAASDTATSGDPILVAWKRMSSERYFNYWRAWFEVLGIALRDQQQYGHFLDGFLSEWLELLTPLVIDAGCPPSHADSIGSLLLASFRGLWMDLLVTGDRERVDRAAEDLAVATRLLIDHLAAELPA